MRHSSGPPPQARGGSPTTVRTISRRRIGAAAAVGAVLAQFSAACAAPPAIAPLSPADGAAIVAAWRAAPEFALPPGLLAQAGALALPDPAVRVRADRAVSSAAVRLAVLEHGGTMDPKAVDKDWVLARPFNASAAFQAARAAKAVPAWAAALARTDPAYLGLLAERRRYAAIRVKGGWPAVRSGPDLKPGSAGPRVAALRARLFAEGFLAADPRPPAAYDATLAAAVSTFQAHHHTTPSGVVDARTRKALNVPVQTRLDAIDASLARARWLPDRLPPERVEVDVANAQATLFQGGRATLTMRAIVGAVAHKTPLFSARMTKIVLNPPWNVPADIAADELYPKERRSPGYFARNGIVASGGRLIQTAGPKASLGLIKFDLDDPYAIYLHDTPARTLFDLRHRALSHGCLRLAAPRALAAALLAAQGWSRPRVDAAIAAGATQDIVLQSAIPVFLVYRTAQTAPDGRAMFRRDIYGWDAKLNGAAAKVARGAPGP